MPRRAHSCGHRNRGSRPTGLLTGGPTRERAMRRSRRSTARMSSSWSSRGRFAPETTAPGPIRTRRSRLATRSIRARVTLVSPRSMRTRAPCAGDTTPAWNLPRGRVAAVSATTSCPECRAAGTAASVCARRIFFPTIDARLIALDAATGPTMPGFRREAASSISSKAWDASSPGSISSPRHPSSHAAGSSSGASCPTTCKLKCLPV